MISFTPKVSLIIPIYNADRYIERTIKSALHQSYKNLEIILVDDGSFDKSSAICKMYVDRYENIFYYYQKNKGVSSARNLGMEKSTGDYIIFLDADDLMGERVVEDLIKNYRNDALTSVQIKRVDSRGKERNVSRRTIYSERDIIHDIMTDKLQGFVWGFIFKKNMCVEFDERINYCEDVVFILNYIIKNKIKCMIFLNKCESYYYYCWNGNSITNSKDNLLKRMQEIDVAMNIIKKMAKKNEIRLIDNREVELLESMMGYLNIEDVESIVKEICLPNYSGLSFRMRYFAYLYRSEQIKKIIFYYKMKDKMKQLLESVDIVNRII